MGVDTVKLSYPVEGRYWTYALPGWAPTGDRGTTGPVWWRRDRNDDLGIEVTWKGVGDHPRLLFEASVSRVLGLCGPAPVECISAIDGAIRRSFSEGGAYLGVADVLRLDVTEDVYDPQHKLLYAALDWTPHERARYVQSQYHEKGEFHTVRQMNKTRGVRVYDKYAECGEQWAIGMTRVEYQIRGDWVDRYGLKRVAGIREADCDRVIAPLVDDLKRRAEQVAAVQPR